MVRKSGNNGPRGSGRRTDFVNALRRGERTIFVTLSKLFILMVFLVLAALAATGGSPLVTALAGVGVFVIAAVLLPVDRLRDGVEWFASGDAGDWLHDRYVGIMPGRSQNDRRGRGQLDMSRIFALLATVVLVSSLLFSGVGAAQESSNDECTDVVHDGYLTDESYVGEYDNTSKISSTSENVKTSIEKTDAFVRVRAENPNAYCVDMTIKVHPDIIPPADVGDLSDTDGEVQSTWRNTHDFERDRSYTEIKFTLDADSSVLFAPNRIRVHTLAWKDEATSKSGIIDRITSPFGGEKDLEQRSYSLESANGSIQTVPLENGDGKSISDWQAVFRTNDGTWRPITTDSSDPAFYRVVDNGSAVQFHFDTDEYADGQVEVQFTANPSDYDKAQYHFRSLSASWSDLTDLDFDIISTVTMPLPSAEVVR
jgi:hypothetical protein